MSKIQLTEEQISAISSRGKVIVSASAGSGKTFVMIERLANLLLEGADVKRILAVTYTTRAAAQMKEKLRSALIEKLKTADRDLRVKIKAQLKALPMADISTTHSFCSRIVKSYFYLVGIDPAFKIASEDSADGSILFSRAMDDVFEAAYAEKDEDLSLLLSVYFLKKDGILKGILRKLYQNIRPLLNYRQILEEENIGLFETCHRDIFQDFNSRIEYTMETLEEVKNFFGFDDPIQTIITERKNALLPLIGRSDLFSMREAIGSGALDFKNMPAASKYSGDAAEYYDALKRADAEVKKIYKDLGVVSGYEEELSRFENAEEIARSVKKMLLRFDDRLTALKRENGVLDYNDLEHYAYQILKNDDARESVAGRYDYIFVDEYQDVNGAQESILNLLSRGQVFFVGDAKQAIYAFRGSRSEFFLNAKKNLPLSLPLNENFRSAPAVLDAVNKVFSRVMTEESSGINYRAEPMRGGARYGGHSGKVNFYYLPKQKKPPKERGIYDMWAKNEKPYDAYSEFIADLIQREVGLEWFDADGDEGRGCVKAVGYGDIALLVRENTAEAKNIVRALIKRDIPVVSAQKVNVCDFWEVRLVIDFLSYLDNPEQDIPLASALLTRIGGLSEEELLTIREAYPLERNFRKAVELYSAREDTTALKVLTFFKRAEKYRAYMRVESCAEIANRLLFDGLEAEICAKEDGQARRARVGKLISQMQGSVGDFLRRLKASGYSVEYLETGAENAVKIMTMHSSKGLEFPIVILVNLDTPFRGEEGDQVMFTERYSFAPKSYDIKSGIVYDNLLRMATSLYNDKEERRGALNLFYVAMTRAKFRLHMIFGEVKTRKLPLLASRLSDFVNFYDCASYFTDVDDAYFSDEVAADEAYEEGERGNLFYRPDPAETERIREVFARAYSGKDRTSLPLKTSATRVMEEEKQEKAAFKSDGRPPCKEDFIEEGLAFHTFMQYADFSKPAAEELGRLKEEGLLTKERYDLIKIPDLERILALPAISKMREKTLLREQRFLAMIPASDIYPTQREDEILVQGAIDALYQDENGWTIIDYKYSSLGSEELKSKYASQISLYRKAVSRALKIDEAGIRAKIVNIRRGEETEM